MVAPVLRADEDTQAQCRRRQGRAAIQIHVTLGFKIKIKIQIEIAPALVPLYKLLTIAQTQTLFRVAQPQPLATPWQVIQPKPQPDARKTTQAPPLAQQISLPTANGLQPSAGCSNTGQLRPEQWLCGASGSPATTAGRVSGPMAPAAASSSRRWVASAELDA